jgi:hypothetical protein
MSKADKRMTKTWYNWNTASQVLLWAIAVTALIVAAIAFAWLPQRDAQENRILQLVDNTTQVLAAASTWQDITYRFTVFLRNQNSGGQHNGDLDVGGVNWKHWFGGSRVRCEKSGVYTFTLSGQFGLITPPTAAPTGAPSPAPTTAAPTAKKRDIVDMEQGPTAAPTLIPTACNDTAGITYMIRAVQQFHEGGNWYEVFASNTFGTQRVTYLSKTFTVNANAGDHLKMQWMSSCQYVVLTPTALNAPLIGPLSWNDDDDSWRLGSFPSSTSLAIY